MKGDDRILDKLQDLLNYEMAARDQYLAHGLKYQDWGLNKLHEQMIHEMEEEQTHIDAIINRMLFLEREPDFTSRADPEVGESVKEMIQNDLDGEILVVERLKSTMRLCEELNDFDTRDILQTLLHDTEMDHIYWLQQQLVLIEQIGLENYLQSKM